MHPSKTLNPLHPLEIYIHNPLPNHRNFLLNPPLLPLNLLPLPSQSLRFLLPPLATPLA